MQEHISSSVAPLYPQAWLYANTLSNITIPKAKVNVNERQDVNVSQLNSKWQKEVLWARLLQNEQFLKHSTTFYTISIFSMRF